VQGTVSGTTPAARDGASPAGVSHPASDRRLTQRWISAAPGAADWQAATSAMTSPPDLTASSCIPGTVQAGIRSQQGALTRQHAVSSSFVTSFGCKYDVGASRPQRNNDGSRRNAWPVPSGVERRLWTCG
jgi:hypothetical protein